MSLTLFISFIVNQNITKANQTHSFVHNYIVLNN